MPSTTRHASNAPRKRAPSRKIPRKRAKTQKPPCNSSSSSPAPSVAKSVSDSELPSEIDVSDVQFTISTTCMLNTHEFLVDSDIVKLNEFSYTNWITKCIRKLAKAGEDSDFNMNWISGCAVISARGVTKANQTTFLLSLKTKMGGGRSKSLLSEG